MKITYENELRALQGWINSANNGLAKGAVTADFASINNIRYQVSTIADGIAEEYPFYAAELRRLSGILFNNSIYEIAVLNSAAFGELFIIIQHIVREPVNMAIWRDIHPRIAKVSRALFCDGYFDSAAEKAIKAVEGRLRELFKELKPDSTTPVKVGEIIGALLTEHGAYQFADLSTVSGKDYRRGIQSIFEGMFAAYRNPSSHGNLQYTRRESIEQIMLASQLMYVLNN